MKNITTKLGGIMLLGVVIMPTLFADAIPVWNRYPPRYYPTYNHTPAPTYSTPSVAVGYSVGVAGYAGGTTFGQTLSGSSTTGNGTSINSAYGHATPGYGSGVGTAGQVNWSVSGVPGANLAGSQTFGNVNNPGTGTVNVGATGYSHTSGAPVFNPFRR